MSNINNLLNNLNKQLLIDMNNLFLEFNIESGNLNKEDEYQLEKKIKDLDNKYNDDLNYLYSYYDVDFDIDTY